jgi:hypothetical protein
MDNWILNWIRCERKRSWPNLMYYPGIYLEGLCKTRNLHQCSRSPDRDMKPGPPEYEAEVCSSPTSLSAVMLSSRYTVPLRCSCGWDCREHEFLDLREYHVWLNYDVRCRRTHWFIGRCTVTRASPGTDTYTTTLGNSQDRSLQLHGATLMTEVYNYTGQLPGTKSTTTRGNSQERSLQLHGATPRTEVYNYTGQLSWPKSTTTRGNSRDWSLQLHWATPMTEVYNYTGKLPGPKSTTTRGNSHDRSLQLHGATPGTKVQLWRWGKNSYHENLHFGSHIANHL